MNKELESLKKSLSPYLPVGDLFEDERMSKKMENKKNNYYEEINHDFDDEIDEIDDEDLEDLEDLEDSEDNIFINGCESGIIIHCKPAANFQSVEFDYIVKDGCDYLKMIKLFKMIQSDLSEIGIEQTVKEPLASDKQKEIMDKFNIPYTNRTTQKEAQNLIKKSIEGK